MRSVTGSFRVLRTAGGLAAGLLALAPARAAPPADPLPEIWRLGAEARFSEAAARLPAPAAGDEELQFTRAVLRFEGPPRTAERRAEAVAVFSHQADAGSTPAVRARGLYFWARAEELRGEGEDPGPAAALYARLWRDYPGQPYGQRALVHRLLLAFYAAAPRVAVLAQCAAIEREAGRLTDPTVRSHFHQVAARGYLQLGGADAQALAHLLEVARLGVSRREARGDLHVSIGQLAAELGRPALAREHYAAFLREFPHDPRAYTVRALLAALPAGEGRTP